MALSLPDAGRHELLLGARVLACTAAAIIVPEGSAEGGRIRAARLAPIKAREVS